MSAPIESTVMRVGGLTLAALERRAGPDLVLFVHGLGCTKESFAGAWEAPELSACSLLAVDLPGNGASPRPEGFACTMEGYADVLRDAVAAFPCRRLHVVAHSMGGAVGLLLAQGGGLPLASFVNVEGNLVAEDCGMMSRRSAGFPVAAFVDAKFPKLLAVTAESDDPDLRRWSAWAARCDPRAFHESCVSLVAWSDSGRLLDVFLGLAVPKVYVYGVRSANDAVLRRLGGVDCIAIPDCGHFIMTEQPAAFHDLVAVHSCAAAASIPA